ncbi:MAG: molybdopterin molybdotransferase MoeA [Gammaproteobacteria bacterium]
MQKWLSVADARRRILDGVLPITQREDVALRRMPGRVLAADIIAPFNVPAFDNSAMDGFACRFDDIGDIGNIGDGEVMLNIVGESFAGRPCAREVAGGECIKIMTGAPLPTGADIVVPVEETRDGGKSQVAITSGKRRRFLHCRFAGEDLPENAVAVCAGQLCRPAHIGLMASLGVGRAEVFRRLRVAFFSTGDELREAGKQKGKLGHGEIYDSNRHTLLAMIERMGFDALDLGVVPDDIGKIESAVDTAAKDADFIISSGGASVGEADFIRQVLASRGEVLFWKVAMRPGRPLAYGKVGEVDFLGLPGNPVSVMVCFYQFAAAALWKKAGRSNITPPPLFPATAAADMRKVKGRTEFQRATLRQDENGKWLATPAADQGSGILSSMANADCFVVLPEESDGAAKGDIVQVQLFEGLV